MNNINYSQLEQSYTLRKVKTIESYCFRKISKYDEQEMRNCYNKMLHAFSIPYNNQNNISK